MVSTRSAPAREIRSATSLAVIGTRGWSFLSCRRVAVVRHHRGDARRRGALEGVEHDQQLHQVVVDRRAGGLDDEDVGAADVLVDLEEDLAVGEVVEGDLARREVRGRRRSSPSARDGRGRRRPSALRTCRHRCGASAPNDRSARRSRRVRTGSHLRISLTEAGFAMVGAGGFEPPVAGSKVPCLTTWLRPRTSARGRAAEPERRRPA